MYRPVRTYFGSARTPRKKQSKIQSDQDESAQQPLPFILGQLPRTSDNSKRSPSRQQSPTRSISPITVASDPSQPIVSGSHTHSRESRSVIRDNTISLLGSAASLPSRGSTTNMYEHPRERSRSPTMEERAQADSQFAKLQSQLNRDSYKTLQARQLHLQKIPASPLPVPPDGRQIFQNISSAYASQITQGGTNSGLGGYISPREFGIPQANPTVNQPGFLEPFDEGRRSVTQRMLGIANGNPTIAQPSAAYLTMPTEQSQGQTVLIREQPSLNYREVEHNLILYSYDRNWLDNTRENRYDFTVNFDTESMRDGFRYSASVDKRYRNIVRIELVKAIIAAESLENVILQMGPNTDPGAALTDTDTTYQVSPLSFPYINIGLQEFDGNNAGTDENLNRTFANLQYDAQWHTDILHQNPPGSDVTALRQTTTRGFLAMIPKYMKCQKIFYPTPLATLQKMSIQFTRPNGQILSALPDQLDILNLYANTDPTFGIDASKFGNQIPATPASSRTVTYLFIQLPYFPRSAFSQGDRIQLDGLLYNRAVLNSYLFDGEALRNLEGWLNRVEGHVIVGLGNNGPNGLSNYQDGPNKIGYANFIIIQSMAINQDGAIYYENVGNSSDINRANAYFCEGPRKLINMSRQTTVIFRVITREMDSITNIRPDNTY